jgi:hypothetical protein
MDPFWHGYGAAYPDERNYVDDIDDIPSLGVALEELFSKYNGMKVLDYQLEENVYDYLLLKPDIRVIFLQRRNLLRAEVSCHIAEQTKVWGMEDMNEERRKIYRNLAPISQKALADSLDYAAELVNHYTHTIRRRPQGTYLEVFYEDLYSKSLAGNRTSVSRVFDFLELELQGGDELDYYLDPLRSRINSETTYGLLSNAEQLNEEFGSDEMGWLFPR